MTLPTTTTSVKTTNGRPILRDEGGIDQHADRHEEDRREHVAHGSDEMLDSLAVARLRYQRASKKGSEGH
jgi:hypothetical protein